MIPYSIALVLNILHW